MKQLLFASSNQAKIAQFQYVAEAYRFNIEIVSVYDKFPTITPYGEEYEAQFEIVEKGAREIYAQTGQPVVVEDTILEVDALDGLPGLRSNAYLKTKSREGLLQALKGKRNRAARTISIVGYYDGRLFISSKNAVEGWIATKESFKQGEPVWVGPTEHPYGGGFNAVFTVDTTGKTLADHSAEEGLQYGYREPNFQTILELLA